MYIVFNTDGPNLTVAHFPRLRAIQARLTKTWGPSSLDDKVKDVFS